MKKFYKRGNAENILKLVVLVEGILFTSKNRISLGNRKKCIKKLENQETYTSLNVSKTSPERRTLRWDRKEEFILDIYKNTCMI